MEHPTTYDGENDNTITKLNKSIGKNSMILIFNILPKVEPSLEKSFSLKDDDKSIIKIINDKIKEILELLLKTKEYEIILACGQHIFTQLYDNMIKELSKFYLVEFMKIINQHKHTILTTKLSKKQIMPVVEIKYPLIRTVQFNKLQRIVLPEYNAIKYDSYISEYIMRNS
jgi:hypothetical protein